MIHRDTVAIRPPLDGGMAGMMKRASNLADAAELLDNCAMGNHAAKVHMKCTSVNMVYVRPRGLRAVMAKESKYDTPIGRLAERAGLSGDRLAKACGWKARNGPQPFLEGKALSLDIAAKFAKGLVGKGEPPVQAAEILDLVEDRGVLEYFWSLGAPRPWAPREDTISLVLESGLLPLTASHVPADDLRLLAHAVTKGLQLVAAQPSMEDDPGFRKAVETTIANAIADYRPPPAQSA